jgi:predicted esterase
MKVKIVQISLVILISCFFTACHHQNIYPIGKINGISTVQYAGNLPMFIFMPDNIQPEGVPIVVFNHGRPFTEDVSVGAYYPSKDYPYLITLLKQNGIASAFPIRSGYYSAPGYDSEKVACNSPNSYELKQAGKSASENIKAAVEYVKSFPGINKNRIFVGGVSAGGFASICSIPLISENVQGVFSLNGGRCGKQGKSINGLAYIEKIYKDIAGNSHIPVAFFSGTNDTVVPQYSTERLYKSFCEGRDNRCNESVYLVIADGAEHSVDSMVRKTGEKIVQFIKHGNLSNMLQNNTLN